jgi:transcriptional regulator with XRE-family HTH domain
MADLQEILGHVIRLERQNQSLTMRELGEKAGLSEIYIGEIERGQKYPSAKVLESLAKALELDLAALLELVAEEIRREREPEITQVIGFTYNTKKSSPPRRATTVRRVMNMLMQYPHPDSRPIINTSRFFPVSPQIYTSIPNILTGISTIGGYMEDEEEEDNLEVRGVGEETEGIGKVLEDKNPLPV